MGETRDVERMDEELRKHELCDSHIEQRGEDYFATYECGVTVPIATSLADAMRSHYAEALAPVAAAIRKEAKAETWDEAYSAGLDDAHDHSLGLASGRENPYRTLGDGGDQS